MSKFLIKRDKKELADSGFIEAKSSKGTLHCVTIIGQIEGHTALPSSCKTTKYEHICPQLAAIEESEEIYGLLILLNTVGGDIEAGLSIAELISHMKTPTVSLILGGGHSIGVPLAVAASHSIIAPSAAMTIHPVRMNGTVVGTPQTFNYFERMQDRITQFVIRNSKISEEKYREFMMETTQLSNDVGSIVYAEQAVNCGLIDRIGGLSDALEYLHNHKK